MEMQLVENVLDVVEFVSGNHESPACKVPSGSCHITGFIWVIFIGFRIQLRA